MTVGTMLRDLSYVAGMWRDLADATSFELLGVPDLAFRPPLGAEALGATGMPLLAPGTDVPRF